MTPLPLRMQLLGHIALGYFSAVIVGRYTKEKFLVPLVWLCALLPDLDAFAWRYIVHRGPTHSIVLAAAIFIPIYIATRRWLPYFAAAASHTLIGDYFNPPEKLFWPLTNGWFGAPTSLSLAGSTLQTVELILFTLMAAVMIFLYLRTRLKRRVAAPESRPTPTPHASSDENKAHATRQLNHAWGDTFAVASKEANNKRAN